MAPKSEASPHLNNAVFKDIAAGNQRALARAISFIIDASSNEDFISLISPIVCFPKKKRPMRIAITGNGGAGKSTLISACIEPMIKENKSIAILASDPTSPISGGALLGDRIRLNQNLRYDKVFFRSLGNQNSGDVFPSTLPLLLELVDIFPCDYCFIETVGSGQADVEICDFVNKTVLLLSPYSGDDIQVMKGGILETCDCIAISHGMSAEAETLKQHLEQWLGIDDRDSSKKKPIFLVDSLSKQGISDFTRCLTAQPKEKEKNNGTSAINKRLGKLLGHLALRHYRQIIQKQCQNDVTCIALGEKLASGAPPLEMIAKLIDERT